MKQIEVSIGVVVINREIMALSKEYNRIVQSSSNNRIDHGENERAIQKVKQQMMALENDRDLLIGLKGFELNTSIRHLSKQRRPIIAYNDLESLEFESITECARTLEINYNSIYQHINNTRMVIKGYKFKDNKVT